MRYFARDRGEIPVTVVLENRSEKAITASSCRWRKLDQSGELRDHRVSSDSYFVDVFRAVGTPGSRHLIGPSGSLDEAMLDHAQAGGSFIGGKFSGSTIGLAEVVEETFAIDLIVFADGEIAGPDPDRFAAFLRCRKRAAEFVAQQVRLADAEGRDATPVISALAEIPHLGRPGHGQGNMIRWCTGQWNLPENSCSARSARSLGVICAKWNFAAWKTVRSCRSFIVGRARPKC